MMRLTNRIYKREAIEEAIADFADVCRIDIADDSFTLSFGSSDIDNIEAEFANYVFGLMKNKGMI